MVKSTTSTILTSGNTSSNSDQQHQQNQQTTSWHRLQTTSECLSLDVNCKANVERLRFLENAPLFVYPHRVCFYIHDSSCCRQEVKLFNPYEWRIHYQVLSTFPSRYAVSPAKSSIGAYRTIDISIRLHNESVKHLGQTTDVLRFQVASDDFTAMGSRYLPIQFSTDKTEYEEFKKTLNNDPAEDKDEPTTIPQSRDIIKTNVIKQTSTVKSDTQGAAASFSSSNNNPAIGSNKREPDSNNWPPPFYIVVAVLCGIVLCLPNETESKLPSFMSVSTTHKIVAAYVLGMLTTLICKFY